MHVPGLLSCGGSPRTKSMLCDSFATSLVPFIALKEAVGLMSINFISKTNDRVMEKVRLKSKL